MADPDANLSRRLKSYINGFSENVREIFHRFRFDDAIRILDEVGRLYLVLTRFESDNDLKDFENVPLGTDIGDYFEREVLPHAPDAWISPDFTDDKDQGVGKVGYEINFNRHFYTYQPPRPVAEIDRDIRKVEKNILGMLKEVMG